MSSILIISQNCNGLRNKMKRQLCFRWFKKQNADIVLVQETHWSKDIEHIIKNEWKGSVFFNHGNHNARGVAILTKRQSNIRYLSDFKDQYGRYLIIECEINTSKYIIVNIYAPNIHTKRELFFKNIHILLSQKFDLQNLQTRLIIGGDFNCVLNPKIDTFNVKSKYKTPSFLKQIIKKLLLIDVWRKVHVDKKQYTWRNKSLQIASRIDFMLISKDLKNDVMKTDIRPVLSGDHNAVSIILKVKGIRIGPGFWKLNSDLLKESEYCENIKEIINNVIKEMKNSCISWREAWELCKIRIREYSIHYAKGKNNKENNVTILEEKLQDLNEKMWKTESKKMREVLNEHERITDQLEKIYRSKCKGSIVRSRVKWFEEGEKNSKYFMSLEKRNSDKSAILLLRNDKQKKIINQQSIRKYVHSFYSKLYSQKESHDLKRYFCGLQNPKLSDELADSCEGPLTEKECKQAMLDFAHNKAPGSDGLNIEFYQFFWTEIKVLLVNSLNESFENNELTNTQRQAIIKLLYKKGDRTNLENWRPISLLNYDYKIAASVLAKRLQRVISTLISSDQVGYIKGRSLAENVRLIEDIFYYVKTYRTRGIALLSDFRKAFDCLSWDFLFECLRMFGFKDDFCKWVSTFYTNIKSCVNVNGWLTEEINISRGVRQGCPLSALLFILTVEILAIKIRSDPEIKGITMFESVEIKILQFADDATIFVEETESLKKAIKLLDDFSLVSGLNLNKSKSSIVDLNGSHVSGNVEGISLNDSNVKILGVYFGNNHDTNHNWASKITKIENVIRQWKARHLTLFGKIIIIKSFLVSQIIYNAQMILMPQNVIKQINTLLYTFLWNGKRDKVKRKVICMKYNFGGLKMVDLNTLFQSFLLKWILHYFSVPESSKWKRVIDGFFGKVGSIQYVLNCSCSKEDLTIYLANIKMPPYYKKMIHAWFEFKESIESNTERNYKCIDIMNEDLWFNPYVKDQDGKILFFKKWFDAGLLKIKDIVKEYSLLSLKEVETVFEKNMHFYFKNITL